MVHCSLMVSNGGLINIYYVWFQSYKQIRGNVIFIFTRFRSKAVLITNYFSYGKKFYAFRFFFENLAFFAHRLSVTVIISYDRVYILHTSMSEMLE